jgi:hypothetical protein
MSSENYDGPPLSEHHAINLMAQHSRRMAEIARRLDEILDDPRSKHEKWADPILGPEIRKLLDELDGINKALRDIADGQVKDTEAGWQERN